jgi:MFS family permease
MGMDTSLYKLVYLLHLGSVIVGFGSAIATSFLAARARDLPPGEGRVLVRAANQVGKALTTGPVVAAGLFGLLLVIMAGENVYKFSQTWISIAFLLWFGVVAVLIFLLAPNARAMDALGTRLEAGETTASKTGGPPKEVAELAERGKKAAAFTGIVHLLWLLLLIDMIWKPGY